MKKLTVLSLMMGALFFLFGAHSDVTFHQDPYITPSLYGLTTETTRWIDQDGRVTWDNSRDQSVGIYALANGLGQGRGSLVNFSFNGGPTIKQHDGSPISIGRRWLTNGFLGFFKKQKYEVERNGQTISARKRVTLPNRPGTYSYTSEGKVVLQPYFWEQTTGGTTVNISITGISVSFSDGSGRWGLSSAETRTMTRYAAREQTGSWTVVNKYRCKLSQCQEEEANAAALERDHGFQASCDTSGCTATGFYECQHTTHLFSPAPRQSGSSGTNTN